MSRGEQKDTVVDAVWAEEPFRQVAIVLTEDGRVAIEIADGSSHDGSGHDLESVPRMRATLESYRVRRLADALLAELEKPARPATEEEP